MPSILTPSEVLFLLHSCPEKDHLKGAAHHFHTYIQVCWLEEISDIDSQSPLTETS